LIFSDASSPGDECRELMRKDITDLKRCCNDEVREKEAVEKASEELRSKVRKCEGDKVDIGRNLSDAKQRILGKFLSN
jgi:hypothetical protein